MSADDQASAHIRDAVSTIDPHEWDAAAGHGNPFVSHAFLKALEDSGSVGPGSGWQPLPIALECGSGFLPAYGKSHSQGEYVFDHSWADAWMRAGGRYYPKLQIAAPFTPVPGPRLLAQDDASAAALIVAAETFTIRHKLSSAHATFIDDRDTARFEAAGWLIREGTQFHWANRGYRDFDDFLDSLSSRKRKAIRKERAGAQEGLDIVAIPGAEITESHWDAFWEFYQDTGARKWGQPYLTRRFFSIAGKTMADSLLLFLALRNGRPIAGALNFIGDDALYGRYWGCSEDVPFLHFELCYYQAIDAAIARGLARVEAGAQGEHKLARGYLPIITRSAHFIPDRGFREAIADFLVRERASIAHQQEFLADLGPFKRG
jgi:uncharacterized protein